MENKPKFMSPAWLRRVGRGRLSFGETFFAGMFGPAFVFVPVGVMVAALFAAAAPSYMMLSITAMTVIYALYFSAVLPAVVKTGLAAKSAGGWRWFGIFLALASTVALWGSVYVFALDI